MISYCMVIICTSDLLSIADAKYPPLFIEWIWKDAHIETFTYQLKVKLVPLVDYGVHGLEVLNFSDYGLAEKVIDMLRTIILFHSLLVKHEIDPFYFAGMPQDKEHYRQHAC